MVEYAEVAFLVDVDNTLFDNDRLISELKAHLEQVFGDHRLTQYWEIFEAQRIKLGYVDYLGALQQYRIQNPHDQNCLEISSFLLNYPFPQLLFSGALEVLARLRTWGPTAIVSDGDVVFQPRKIDRSGILRAVDGRVLLYIHKEQELADVEARCPARHYVFIDDKPTILGAIKKAWGYRVTTVFPRQGHYANDAATVAHFPPADVTVQHIGDLLTFDLPSLLRSSRPATSP